MLARLRAWLTGSPARKRVAVAGAAVTLMISATVVRNSSTVEGSSWPTAATTGVPAGTTLTAYSGPNPITVANTVIDSKTITGDLTVSAANVTIRKSVINGSIYIDRSVTSGVSLTLDDSEIDGGNDGTVDTTGLCCTDYIASRVEFRGGKRGAWCYYLCTIQDSWVHGQAWSTTLHESGIRAEERANILRNRIECTAPEQAPDGGCSAGLTGYPDFKPIQFNVIDGNYFGATPGGWCAYFGDTASKPYSGLTNHITVTNNTFEDPDGPTGTNSCGIFDWYTDFPESDPNSVWSNNKTSLGVVLPATL